MTVNKPGIDGNFLNVIKGMHEKPTANIKLNFERLNSFPLRSGTKGGNQLSSLLFNIVLEVLVKAGIK